MAAGVSLRNSPQSRRRAPKGNAVKHFHAGKTSPNGVAEVAKASDERQPAFDGPNSGEFGYAQCFTALSAEVRLNAKPRNDWARLSALI